MRGGHLGYAHKLRQVPQIRSGPRSASYLTFPVCWTVYEESSVQDKLKETKFSSVSDSDQTQQKFKLFLLFPSSLWMFAGFIVSQVS